MSHCGVFFWPYLQTTGLWFHPFLLVIHRAAFAEKQEGSFPNWPQAVKQEALLFSADTTCAFSCSSCNTNLCMISIPAWFYPNGFASRRIHLSCKIFIWHFGCLPFGDKHKVWEVVWWACIWQRGAEAAGWDLCWLTACPPSAEQLVAARGDSHWGQHSAGALLPWWVCRVIPQVYSLGNGRNSSSIRGEGKQPGSGAPSKVLSLFLPSFTPAWLTLH